VCPCLNVVFKLSHKLEKTVACQSRRRYFCLFPPVRVQDAQPATLTGHIHNARTAGRLSKQRSHGVYKFHSAPKVGFERRCGLITKGGRIPTFECDT
jgi:hypothetical protein